MFYNFCIKNAQFLDIFFPHFQIHLSFNITTMRHLTSFIFFQKCSFSFLFFSFFSNLLFPLAFTHQERSSKLLLLFPKVRMFLRSPHISFCIRYTKCIWTFYPPPRSWEGGWECVHSWWTHFQIRLTSLSSVCLSVCVFFFLEPTL